MFTTVMKAVQNSDLPSASPWTPCWRHPGTGHRWGPRGHWGSPSWLLLLPWRCFPSRAGWLDLIGRTDSSIKPIIGKQHVRLWGLNRLAHCCNRSHFKMIPVIHGPKKRCEEIALNQMLPHIWRFPLYSCQKTKHPHMPMLLRGFGNLIWCQLNCCVWIHVAETFVVCQLETFKLLFLLEFSCIGRSVFPPFDTYCLLWLYLETHSLIDGWISGFTQINY